MYSDTYTFTFQTDDQYKWIFHSSNFDERFEQNVWGDKVEVWRQNYQQKRKLVQGFFCNKNVRTS